MERHRMTHGGKGWRHVLHLLLLTSHAAGWVTSAQVGHACFIEMDVTYENPERKTWKKEWERNKGLRCANSRHVVIGVLPHLTVRSMNRDWRSSVMWRHDSINVFRMLQFRGTLRTAQLATRPRPHPPTREAERLRWAGWPLIPWYAHPPCTYNATPCDVVQSTIASNSVTDRHCNCIITKTIYILTTTILLAWSLVSAIHAKTSYRLQVSTSGVGFLFISVMSRDVHTHTSKQDR